MGKFSKKHYGKVVGKDSDERPGWKGPSFTKKTTQQKVKAVVTEDGETEPIAEPLVPVELQQLLLNIFKDAFPELLASESLQSTMQEVKGALYDRDFHRAFGKPEYLEAYSVRWSASRALGYQSILVDISEHLSDVLPLPSSLGLRENAPQVACFGGGSAEVVAFAGFLKYLKDCDSETSLDTRDISTTLEALSISKENADTIPQSTFGALLVDSADWHDAVEKLCRSVITPPTLSKYASAAAKAANTKTLLNARDLATRYLFSQDILKMSQDQLNAHVGQQKMLLTMLFTLNELYTASIPQTTAFLLKLTVAVKPGSVLLVVDSPGSYSETIIGTESKNYPMKWLLDHFLLAKADEKQANWIKLLSEDSKWFRLPETLRYPIPLENMRYQIHVYRRL